MSLTVNRLNEVHKHLQEKREKKERREAQVRRGKNAKRKGADFERKVAKMFQERYGIELVRTPQSGGFAKNKTAKGEEFRGDIVPVDKDTELKLHIECKNQKIWKLPEWLNQAKEDCPEGKFPSVVFKKFNTSETYIAMSIENFFALVPSITKE